MKRSATYDQKCFDLAKSFLIDDGNRSEEAADRLASLIQTTIEEFINDPECD